MNIVNPEMDNYNHEAKLRLLTYYALCTCFAQTRFSKASVYETNALVMISCWVFSGLCVRSN